MISIVIPVFNEEESLQFLYPELVKELPSLGSNFEIIFIDDGSSDNSLEKLKNFAAKDRHVRIFSFRINLGKASALNFGFSKAKGDLIVTLDADLQDKPSEIKKLLEKSQQGWEVVCGWRKSRKDTFIKKVFSRFFNRLTNFFWGLNLHDYNCGLKIFTKEAAKSLYLYGGLYRFIPVLIHRQGFSVTEERVSHRERRFGKSKYGVSKIWKDLPDIFTMLFITRYGNRPLHFFGLFGGILFIIGTGILIYLTILRFQGEIIGRRPILFIGMLFVISGFQVFLTGFLADLFLNTFYRNSQNGAKDDYSLRYTSDAK